MALLAITVNGPKMTRDASASEIAKARERVAQLTAHRACHAAEHDPLHGRIHGYCVVCGVPWPCEYAGTAPPTYAWAIIQALAGIYTPQPQQTCIHDFKDYVVCCKCGKTAAATGDCHHCNDPDSLRNGRCWWCLTPREPKP